MIVFSKSWFLKHQQILLWFVNTWIGKRFFRIHGDAPKGKRIISILPNCYTWAHEDGRRTTDFRTYDQFGKQLYDSLKPLWYVLHFLDWLFLDRWFPEYSFGFDTLTAYPYDGYPGSPCSGYVYRDNSSGETFAALKSGVGTAVNGGLGGTLVTYGAGSNWRRLSRFFCMFDTSSLDGTTITAATLSLFAYTGKANAIGLTDAEAGRGITGCNTAVTTYLILSDYQTVNNTRLASDIPYSGWTESAYNDYALNSTGLGYINKTGVTKFSARLAVDIDGSPSAWLANKTNNLRAYAAGEYTGRTRDPKLVVTYDHAINCAGIATAFASGSHAVVPESAAAGIATAFASGSHAIQPAVVPSGIASVEAFGSLGSTVNVAASSIASAQAFGSPVIKVMPSIVTYTLPKTYTDGLPFSKEIEVSGGTAPFTWSITAGALPDGLSLSSAGVLSGTPTETGTFTFTVQVEDDVSATDSRELTLEVGCLYDDAVAALSRQHQIIVVL